MATARAEIRVLIKDMKKIPPDLRKQLRPALRKGAEPILADAKIRAGWSTRIPRATRIATTFTKKRAGVAIRTSAKKAPHARPYENLGNAGTFRHPVYALPRKREMVYGREIPGAFNKTAWVPQSARPFLFPAVDAKGGAVVDALGETVVSIARENGWK
jgi:hypothetical protein